MIGSAKSRSIVKRGPAWTRQGAGVGRAQIEAAADGRAQRVDQLAPHHLAACDEGVTRADKLLHDEDAVAQFPELAGVHRGRELVGGVEELDADPFAAAVRLHQEGAVHPPPRLAEAAQPDGRHRARNPDFGRAERGGEGGLAHSQLEGFARIDHAPSVRLEPMQHGARILDREHMAAGMGRAAQPVEKHPLRRGLGQVQRAGT